MIGLEAGAFAQLIHQGGQKMWDLLEPLDFTQVFISLNNLSLDKDIVTINIPGHELIFTEIKFILRIIFKDAEEKKEDIVF